MQSTYLVVKYSNDCENISLQLHGNPEVTKKFIMNITAKVNDRNDISQANRKLLSISQGIKLSKQIFVAKDIQQ